MFDWVLEADIYRLEKQVATAQSPEEMQRLRSLLAKKESQLARLKARGASEGRLPTPPKDREHAGSDPLTAPKRDGAARAKDLAGGVEGGLESGSAGGPSQSDADRTHAGDKRRAGKR